MVNISISEINSYLTCRRAWDITSANRQSLRHKVTPKIYFVIGNAIHEAIDAQARGDDPFDFFEEYVSRERADRKEAYEEAVGSSPWQSEMEEFEDSVNLARSLVEQYFDHYSAENPLQSEGLKYVSTEVPFSIPLQGYGGPDVNFVGTFDGIATDLETETKFWLTENKTYDRRPDMAVVQRSNQFVGYNWAFRALTGATPAGTLYNGIAKRLVEKPKYLKSGELSQNKQANVTYAGYLDAIKRGGHDPVKYLSYLEFLEERERNGDDRFFFREIFNYSNAQLDNWFRHVLIPAAWELHNAIKGMIHLTPNYNNCRGCLVQDLCTAMDLEEDFHALADAKYEVKTYGTIEAVNGVTPTMVSSAEDIVSVLRGQNG